MRGVGDPADAADVVAETYLVAWRLLTTSPTGSRKVCGWKALTCNGFR